MATISDDLASGLTKTLQIAQLDLQNQDKMFSSAQTDVTLTRADGSTFAAATWAKMMAATIDNIKKRGNLGVNNLNEINGTLEGFWHQPNNSNAIASRNYPETQAGSLLVMQNGANGSTGCTQVYYPYNSNNTWIRSGIANASGIASWTTWQKLAYTNDPTFSGKVVFPIGFLAMQSSSDRELKKSIKYTPKKARLVALGEVMQWATATFKFKARGDGLIPESDTKLGFIANDLKEVSPECVEGEGLAEGDELDPTKAFSLDTVAMMAKMTMAMQAMEDQITDLQNTVKNLKEKVFSQ